MKTEFTKSGFHHRQIERKGRIAMFERWKGNQKKHFEVVRVREHAAYEMAGVVIPAGESYPSSERWGTDGFTYLTKDEADKRFAAMVVEEGGL